MIYQALMFAHINSRYHAFKVEVLKDSHCETAHFLARYMYIIQMVLTLIRATRQTILNCMSALSVCLVPNAHCTQTQRYTSQMQRTSQTKWVYDVDLELTLPFFLGSVPWSLSTPDRMSTRTDKSKLLHGLQSTLNQY